MVDEELELAESAVSGAVFPPIELLAEEDELELEPNGIPNPVDPPEELDDVSPPGRFGANAGWPPALVLEGWPELVVELSVAVEPPTAPPVGA
jgi:hypothetical protein